MDPFEKFRQVLATLSWVFDGEIEVKPAPKNTIDLSPLREGKYVCEADQCARADIQVLSVWSPRDAYGFDMEKSTGFFREPRRIGDEIHCSINWDDGSGHTTTEQIQLFLLGESCFKLVDSSGSTNLYRLEEESELFLEPDEIEEFISDTLSDDLLHKIGQEGSEIGLCPYITFYVYHTEDDYLPLVDKMVAIDKAFEQLIDEPFQLVWKDDTQDWLPPDDMRLPSLDDFPALARIQQEELRPFWIRATDQEDPVTTARWAICAEIDDGGMHYTTLKLTFRHKWYNQNKSRWQSFIKDCIAQLQPEHCYSGFEVGNGGFNILGAYEAEVLERICADYFYGMDVDHLSKMGFHSYRYHRDDPIFCPELVEGDDPSEKYTDPTDLGAGLRPPTWSFLLTPFWLAKLGKTAVEVRAELDDPRIEITTIPYAVGPHNPNGEPALWIRLGELDLHPVENGVPELLVKANRLIRPIRCDDLNLLTLDSWDDDPNPRFDYESSQRWMRRFDEDSDWPNAEKRKAGSPAIRRSNVPGGNPCPEPGWWFTPAQANSRRYFKQGETMPSVGGDYGQTFWQWSPDQSAPKL